MYCTTRRVPHIAFLHVEYLYPALSSVHSPPARESHTAKRACRLSSFACKAMADDWLDSELKLARIRNTDGHGMGSNKTSARFKPIQDLETMAMEEGDMAVACLPRRRIQGPFTLSAVGVLALFVGATIVWVCTSALQPSVSNNGALLSAPPPQTQHVHQSMPPASPRPLPSTYPPPMLVSSLVAKFTEISSPSPPPKPALLSMPQLLLPQVSAQPQLLSSANLIAAASPAPVLPNDIPPRSLPPPGLVVAITKEPACDLWCATHPASVDTKCTFHACSGCEICSMPRAPPSPPWLPAPAPSPPPPPARKVPTVVDCINERFAHGGPHNSLRQAGVLIHMSDNLEDKSEARNESSNQLTMMKRSYHVPACS